MADVIPEAELTAITSLEELQAWTGLPDDAWLAVNSRLGMAANLRIFAHIPLEAFTESVFTARVIIPAQGQVGDDDHVPAADRDLTPVEITQVGLMFTVARLKYGKATEELFAAQPVPPPAPAVRQVTPATTGGQRKIKNNQVLDQADEGEIPVLTQEVLDGHYQTLRKIKGGPVRPENEPSPDQIAAMRVRVLELGLQPYADFAIFVNFQGRFSKSLKFLNHVLQPDGTFKAVEVPGPPNFDAWSQSWKVYVNTLLTLEVEVNMVKVPVVSPAATEEYHDMFRDLVKNYPEAWHLLVIAEDRCRGEHFARLRREPEEQHKRGLAPAFEPGRPWDEVFRSAARDREYWDRHVREPAILFRTSGKHKEQSGGTGTGTNLAGHTQDTRKPKARPSQKERLKRQLAKLKEGVDTGPSDHHKPGKGAGKDRGKGAKRDGQGRYVTDRQGRPICFGYNNGDCTGTCPKAMQHVCQICLAGHPAKTCRKASSA
eukprot:s2560_g11.t1